MSGTWCSAVLISNLIISLLLIVSVIGWSIPVYVLSIALSKFFDWLKKIGIIS
jgi:hypothetical protein